MAQITQVENSISFIDAISKLLKRPTSIHTFRGQRNSAWMDDPAILRDPMKLLPHEHDAIRDLHSIHPEEFRQDQNMFDRLVRMQHYGLPTRLLDVSSNPLVALYFATVPYRSKLSDINGRVIIYDVPKIRRKYFDSDSVSCVANLANLTQPEKDVLLSHEDLSVSDFNQLPECDRLIHFIKSEKSYFRPIIKPKDLSRAYYVTPKMQNSRIIAQHGSFIIFGLKIVRTPKSKTSDDGIIKSIIDIPQSAKIRIRKELQDLGINSSILFPELSHAAEEIVKRYGQ